MAADRVQTLGPTEVWGAGDGLVAYETHLIVGGVKEKYVFKF